jgi:hypothetical protein
LIFFCSHSSVAPDPHRRQGQPRAIARPSGRIAGVLARGLDTVAHLVLRGARRRAYRKLHWVRRRSCVEEPAAANGYAAKHAAGNRLHLWIPLFASYLKSPLLSGADALDRTTEHGPTNKARAGSRPPPAIGTVAGRDRLNRWVVRTALSFPRTSLSLSLSISTFSWRSCTGGGRRSAPSDGVTCYRRWELDSIFKRKGSSPSQYPPMNDTMFWQVYMPAVECWLE